jgi:hypothetical protein
MSTHTQGPDGLNLCGNDWPDVPGVTCPLCKIASERIPGHSCDIEQFGDRFSAVCACGWQGKRASTPSLAYREVRIHWREMREGKQPRYKKKTPALCHCGCTQQTAGGTFAPGHDARWISDLRRQVHNGQIVEAEAKKAVGAISPRLLIKFQHALDGRPMI